jgi:hypothetical protein
LGITIAQVSPLFSIHIHTDV